MGAPRRAGKFQTKTGTAPQLAIDFNDAVVFLNNSVGDREPQPRPFLGTFGAEERIIDSRQIFGRDTLPCVGDFDVGKTALGPSSNGKRSARRHRVTRIDEEVQKYLLQFSRVAAYGRQIV